MDREPFMETKSVLWAYRTRKAISKIYDYLNLGRTAPTGRTMSCCQGETMPKSNGITVPEEKKFKFYTNVNQ